MVTKQEEDRYHAEIQADAFLEILANRYGIESKDIPEILDDLRWMRKHRNSINRISWSIALAVLAVAVSGVVAAFWEGVKQYVKR